MNFYRVLIISGMLWSIGCGASSESVTVSPTKTIGGFVTRIVGGTNSETLYVATSKSGVYAIDGNTLQTSKHYPSEAWLRPIAVNTALTRLASGQESPRTGFVEMRHLPGGAQMWANQMSGIEVLDVAFCGRYDWLVTCGPGFGESTYESTISIFNPQTGEKVGNMSKVDGDARYIAASSSENCFAVWFLPPGAPRPGVLRGWEFQVSANGIVFTPLSELELDGVNCISCFDICPPVLWIARDNECLLFDWKTRRMQRFPLAENLRLDWIAGLDAGRRAIGLCDKSVFLLQEEAGVLLAERIAPRKWMMRVGGLADSNACYAFGPEGDDHSRIGIVSLSEKLTK